MCHSPQNISLRTETPHTQQPAPQGESRMRRQPLLGLQTQERDPRQTEPCGPCQGSELGHRGGETDQIWKHLEHEKEPGQKMGQHEPPHPRSPCLPALLPPIPTPGYARRMSPKGRLDHGTSCLETSGGSPSPWLHFSSHRT